MRFVKAILIWVLITPLAIINGGLRDFVIEPLLGNSMALPLSGIILSILVFLMAYLLIPKIGGCNTREYIFIGIIWFILTNLFDLAMIVIENGQVSDLVKMYDITMGNLWMLVVIACLISPVLTAKISKLTN